MNTPPTDHHAPATSLTQQEQMAALWEEIAQFRKLAQLNEKQYLELREALSIGSDYTHAEALAIARTVD